MKTFYKSILMVFVFGGGWCVGFSQNSLVKQWDYRFGGNGNERLYSFQQIVDRGYILGGSTTSTSIGFSDFWFVKTDSLGHFKWDEGFGGYSAENISSLQQTGDKGYILGGTTYSTIGGDKTQPKWGGYDYWVVKADSFHHKQWDKDFGSFADDSLYSLQQTADGGYILGGFSNSDIYGDKTQATWGNFDYWIVKIDSAGNKEWDKDLGGTGDDRLHYIQQTSDGGYILAGYSSSGISGDKTQNVWGTNGDIDYWIVKTNYMGIKQWDKDLGGTNADIFNSLYQTNDGGYILGGISSSDISGDKTQDSRGFNDYWIIKIDSLGNKQWDKTFGGTDNEDEFGTILQTSDGGYLFAGSSYSNTSGDKTEDNLGPKQTWVVKTDSVGNKQWDKTLHTLHLSSQQLDKSGLAIQTNDGCYLMGNTTNAGIGGDKTGTNVGGEDFWIIKFCDSILTTSITQLPNTQLPFSIFPNPTSGNVQITFSNFNKVSNSIKVEIINVMGEKVFQSTFNNQQSSINLNLSFLAKGIYLVRVWNGLEFVNKKLLVE